jgi:hypothetical protein
MLPADYFLGVAGATLSTGISLRSVLTPSGVVFVFGVVDGLGSGVPPFTGEPDGEGLGLVTTTAVAEGDGEAAGLLGAVFGAEPQAIASAAFAARMVESINCLLIISPLKKCLVERHSFEAAEQTSQPDWRQEASFVQTSKVCRLGHTNAALCRTTRRQVSCRIFSCMTKGLFRDSEVDRLGRDG